MTGRPHGTEAARFIRVAAWPDRFKKFQDNIQDGWKVSPFFFLARGKASRPLGRYSRTTASGFPGIIPSILRYNRANDVVVELLVDFRSASLSPYTFHMATAGEIFLCP